MMGWTMHSNEVGFGLYYNGKLVGSAREDLETMTDELMDLGESLGMADPREVGYDDAVEGLSANPQRHDFTGRGYDSLIEMYHDRYDDGLTDPDAKEQA